MTGKELRTTATRGDRAKRGFAASRRGLRWPPSAAGGSEKPLGKWGSVAKVAFGAPPGRVPTGRCSELDRAARCRYPFGLGVAAVDLAITGAPWALVEAVWRAVERLDLRRVADRYAP